MTRFPGAQFPGARLLGAALFALFATASVSASAAGRVDALPASACMSLADNLESRLDAQAGFRVAVAGLDRHQQKAFGLDGTRCWLWARIGGYALPETGLDRLADRLSTALGALGWVETDDMRPFAADGPDGTVFARARNKETCVVSVDVEDLRPAPPSSPAAPFETAYRFDISCFAKRW